jgi:hypothetical protein
MQGDPLKRQIPLVAVALIAWALGGAAIAQASSGRCEWTLDVPATGGTFSKCIDSDGDDYLLTCSSDGDCVKQYSAD